MLGNEDRENIMMAEHIATKTIDFIPFRAIVFGGSMEKNNFYNLLHIESHGDHFRKLVFFLRVEPVF